MMGTPRSIRNLAMDCETRASWARNCATESNRMAAMAIMRKQIEAANGCRMFANEMEAVADLLDRASDEMRRMQE